MDRSKEKPPVYSEGKKLTKDEIIECVLYVHDLILDGDYKYARECLLDMALKLDRKNFVNL